MQNKLVKYSDFYSFLRLFLWERKKNSRSTSGFEIRVSQTRTIISPYFQRYQSFYDNLGNTLRPWVDTIYLVPGYCTRYQVPLRYRTHTNNNTTRTSELEFNSAVSKSSSPPPRQVSPTSHALSTRFLTKATILCLAMRSTFRFAEQKNTIILSFASSPSSHQLLL